MTHIAFQERSKDVELEADYVVVGSGAGGSMAAVTLARGGASVAIVEAGPWLDPEHYPFSTYGAMRDLMDDWSTATTAGRAIWPIVQGRAVGGSTVINSAICVRTPGDIFEQWRREDGVGGRAMADAVWRYQDQIENELCATEVPPDALGNSNLLALKGDRKINAGGHAMIRYVKGCLGSGQCLQGCTKLRKQSTNLNYIPEVMRRGGSVLSCAPVGKVLFERNRAVGVMGRFLHPRTRKKGASFSVRANKAVLIAASATHSPNVLRRSGFKSPALGEFFRAHPGTALVGCYEEQVDMNIGATQGWASTKFRDDPGLKLETLSVPPEMIASRIAGGGTQLMERLSEYRHLAMWVLAVRAETIGRVGSVFGMPRVSYTLNRADMQRMSIGVGKVARLHFAAGAKAVIPGIAGYPFKVTPDQVHLLDNAPIEPRKYVGILSHLFGGCVMGADPARSVCDGRGRVHGVDGLVVVDASAIPSNLGVNPQHTIMGLAAVFSEQLLND